MNILGYVNKNHESFIDLPFNDVDALVICWMAYFDFTPVKEKLPIKIGEFKDIKEYRELDPYIDSFFPRFSRRYMKSLISSNRFKEVTLIDYEYVIDKKNNAQFDAIAVRILDKIIISIRGTDPSYLGWKEDFTLSYKNHIHSYLLGEKFLKRIMENYQEDIILCGHSKGGNVCTYLLSNLDDVSRIKRVISFDGPGFRNITLFKNKEERLEKFIKIVPQSSVVGVLFSNETEINIIKSHNVMALQHNPFEWQVKDHDFIYVKKRTLSSRYLEKSLNGWIDSLNEEEKERFTEIIFGELDKFKTQDLTNFIKKILLQIKPIYKAYRGLNKEDKKLVNKVIMKLIKNFIKPEKKSIN